MSNKDVDITNNLSGPLKVETIAAAGTTMSLEIPSGDLGSLSSDGLDSILFDLLDSHDLVLFSINTTRAYTLTPLVPNRKWQFEFGEPESEERTIPVIYPEEAKTTISIGNPRGDQEFSKKVFYGAVSLMLVATVVSTVLAPELKEFSREAWLIALGTLGVGSIVTGFLSLSRTIREKGKRLRLTGRVKRFKK